MCIEQGQRLLVGRAPSSYLAGAFQHSQNSASYRNLDNISAPLSDDIRGVFDRMLATPQEIARKNGGVVGVRGSRHSKPTMFNSIKGFIQRLTRGDVEAMRVRGDKPFDIVDNTSNLLGNFMDVEAGRDNISKALLHAAKRTMGEIAFKGNFVELFDLNATATMRQAATVAEQFADKLYTDKDATMSMMSDAYSLIAVLCNGRLGHYRGTDGQDIFEMAAELFGRYGPPIITSPGG